MIGTHASTHGMVDGGRPENPTHKRAATASQVPQVLPRRWSTNPHLATRICERSGSFTYRVHPRPIRTNRAYPPLPGFAVRERSAEYEREIEALRQRLAELEEEVQTARAARDRFLRLVTHELKTPLAVMSGFTELLRTGEAPAAQQERWLDLILENARRLNQAIDDLLAFAQIHRGEFEITRLRVSLQPLLRDLVESLQPVVAQKNQGLDLSLPEEPVSILGDPDRLFQMLSNLLSNASKYSLEGTLIRVEAIEEQSQALISIIDQGHGIDPEERERVFEPFYRCDNVPTQRVPGVGLGLAIARAIAEAHGGEITLQSAVGEGSTFAAVLPAADA